MHINVDVVFDTDKGEQFSVGYESQYNQLFPLEVHGIYDKEDKSTTIPKMLLEEITEEVAMQIKEQVERGIRFELDPEHYR